MDEHAFDTVWGWCRIKKSELPSLDALSGLGKTDGNFTACDAVIAQRFLMILDPVETANLF